MGASNDSTNEADMNRISEWERRPGRTIQKTVYYPKSKSKVRGTQDAAQNRTQNTEHRTQNTEHRTQNRTQNTEHRTQNTEHRTQNTEHRKQNTEHRTQ